MAEKPETRFKNRIKPLLESLPHSYWVKISHANIVGCPDFYGCVNGNMVLIELKKSDKERVAPMQEWHLHRVSQAGGIGLIVFPENWEDSFAFLYSLAYNASTNLPGSEEPSEGGTIQ